MKFSLKIFFCLIASHTFSQGLFTKRLGIEDGLLSYDNYNLLCDKKGNVWVCSKFGIVKFSSRENKKFTTRDGLFSNDVWHLDEDLEGRIWLSSFSKGIQYIKNDKIESIKEFNDFEQVFYSGSVKDTTFFTVKTKSTFHRYYFTSGKVERYKRFNNKGLTVYIDLRDEDALILVDTNLSKENESYLYNTKTGKITDLNGRTLNISYGPPKDFPTILRQTQNNQWKYFYIHKGNLSLFNKKEKEINAHSKLIESQQFILVVNGDVKIYDKRTFRRRIDIEQLLKSQLPTKFTKGFAGHFVEDNNSNIWMAEPRGGIYFIHNEANSKTELFSTDNLENNRELLQPCSVENSDFFIYRTFDNTIYLFNPISGRKTSLIKSDGAIRKIDVRDKILYVLYVNKLETFPINIRDEKIVQHQKTIYQFSDIALSFDFLSDTSIVLSNKKVINLVTKSLVDDKRFSKLTLPFRTYSIHINQNKLYYHSDNEVGYFDVETKKQYIIPINNPTFIKRIGQNTIIESSQSGVFNFDILQHKKIQLSSTILSINDIIPYKQYFLVCSNIGLFLVDINPNKWLVKRSLLSDPSLGIMVNSAIVTSNSVIAFTNQGAISIKTSELSDNSSIENSFYCRVTDIYSKNIATGSVLSNQNNAIHVEFHDGSFFSYTNKVFRYQLIGRDSQWQYSKNAKISYTDLKSGNYTFIIENSDSEHGVFSNRKTIEFKIDIPFYNKIWFYLICGAVFILMFTSIYYYRRSLVLRKKNIQAKMRELELKALKAQLNPHFVFNALNGIQSLAYKENKIKLNEYICSFSDLIRNVLDASRQEKITLQEETIFLTNYLIVEKIRLKDSLQFEINCHPNIDSQSVTIYGMIIQPIVENCIVHAFRTDQNEKHIQINFEIKENVLITTITDNGIGRLKSEELKQGKAHKSWSSTILQEKSALLNSINKNEISIETIDLYHNAKQPIGTKVVVKMKI